MPTPLTPAAALRQDFAPLFSGHERRISPMHALLNLHEDPTDTAALFRTVHQTLLALPQPAPKVHALIQDSNWRENLVAIGCIFVSQDLRDPQTLALAWQCFDRESWVTPQWAALLSLVDPQFLQQARHRLLYTRMILGVGAREIGPFGEDDDPHPTAQFHLGSKSIAALFRLYQAHPKVDFALLSRLEQGPLPAFLHEESLIDNGGLLAQNWVRRATAASTLFS